MTQDSLKDTILSTGAPALFDSFAAKLESVDRDEPLILTYSLTCEACGSERFAVSAHPVIVPDPSPYHALTPGDTLQRPPHRARCAECGHIAALFDPRRQGYDGVLGHGSGYECGDEGEAFLDGPYRLAVSLTYNAEAEELVEIAEEADVKPADLFDWIAIAGKPIEDAEPIDWDYECA